MNISRLGLLMLLMTAGAGAPAVAQVNPAFSDLTAAVEDARAIVQTERRLLISQALELTPEETTAFWPIYDKYAAELKKAGDLRVKVITDFAAAFDSLSDETANRLLDDSLRYQEQALKIRRGYVRKFRKVLPPVKLARFYQVENKLDAITNFALAREIPLVQTPGQSSPLSAP